ncbi:MAG: NlpC/P60 family protein [Thermoleophilia bacterium]|nr:NlpC/P60 family protein [Thermoleophilia bacterium]
MRRTGNNIKLQGMLVIGALVAALFTSVGSAAAAAPVEFGPTSVNAKTSRAARAAGPWGWSTPARTWAQGAKVLPAALVAKGPTARLTRAQFAVSLLQVEALRAARTGGDRPLANAGAGKVLPDARAGSLGARVVGLGWLRPVNGKFAPYAAISADDAALAMTGVLGLRGDVTTLARKLRSEVPGAKTNYALAAAHALNRTVGLRFNVLDPYDRLELGPREAVNVAHGAYMLHVAATRLDRWKLDEAHRLAEEFELPDLGANQALILRTAVAQLGQPYIWAGETEGRQSEGHGGFDCSGFTIRSINSSGVPAAQIAPIGERTSYAQSDVPAARRIARDALQPGDAMFFAPNGGATSPADNYHAGVYMGNGWFIHSSGGNGGVAINSLDGWWGSSFSWGRRALKQP